MKRDIEQELVNWKNQKDRYPLIIRGARQVGKSYLIETFAKGCFQNIVVVNFELQPSLKDCFEEIEPEKIINKLQLVLGVQISPDNTLLFLDEIQDCPRSIIALRYFREKMPSLAVIGAGSLLEFALRSIDIKVPVGRIHFLYLEPMSFLEFLTASGNESIREYISDIKNYDKIEDVVHKRLLELLHVYTIVGGMPAVVREYIENRDLLKCQHLQTALLQTYRSDFGKYARFSQHKYLYKVFDSAPRLVGQRVKYTHIDSETKSRDVKNAIELLTLAGVIIPIYASKVVGIPLGARINEKKFKLNFLDIGLMQNACGLQALTSIQQDFMQINLGAVAEQLVGQELRAYSDVYRQRQLFFWARDKRGSSAEVDYIIETDSGIVPIEVKAGKGGTLKSLQMFLNEKRLPLGIRISADKLYYHNKILSLPLYMIKQIPNIIKKVVSYS